MTTLARLLGQAGARLALIALLAAGAGSCGGGGPGLPPLSVLLFNFSPGFGGVHLNSPLELTFSAPLDSGTVNSDSIRIFTTTTTTESPDPGAPAIGEFLVSGNVLVFRPRVPRFADLSDTGLRVGFTYAVEVPASPDVIDPVRTIEGDPNVVNFIEFFSTLNSTILPAPGDITAEPNLPQLYKFFIDEFDWSNSIGQDPCDRLQRDAFGQPILDSFGNPLPAFPGALDAPQVIDTDPAEGERGFGTITGVQPGLGTAFVRLDPITLLFSEPISPWRIRSQNISIQNINLGGETFDLFFFFTQDREEVKLQITVFDANSAFDQASVPQGTYTLTLTQFTDLAGNPLVNPKGTAGCEATGTFELQFSTVSTPTLPTDLTLTFQDEDGNGYVDYGGLNTAVHNSNALPEFTPPFLGGLSVDYVANPSPSNQTSTGNWGDTAFWTGFEVLFDNGYDPADPTRQIPQAMRLRGGTNAGATPILCPLAGRAIGPSDPAGTTAGIEFDTDTDGIGPDVAEPGKVNFRLVGSGTAEYFTGNPTTGPIVYHYNTFDLLEDAGNRPRITYRKVSRDDSLFPLIIFVEDRATITGDVILDGKNGELGFNGPNDGTNLGRNPGGLGGYGGPGGGWGGDGGSSTLGSSAALVDGQNGGVPANVIGPLDQLSEAIAGLSGMSTGGGGRFDETQPKDSDTDGTIDVIPAYEGGGGGGTRSGGGSGGDLTSVTPGVTDHGVGGQQVGTATADFGELGILASGGAGGGGGAADDDGGGTGDLLNALANDLADLFDDGGGGGGGGGGFFGLSCRGDITLGYTDFGDPGDPGDDDIRPAILRCVGGRGGSTYETVSGSPPAPADPSDPIGQGEGGGGGGGGGISIISGGLLTVPAAEIYVFGKRGGNSPDIEGGSRVVQDEAGGGGGGKIYVADADGVDVLTELVTNPFVFLVPDSGRAGLTPEQIQDFDEMTGTITVAGSTWGDDPRESMFGTTQIVTEFFDTLSDQTSYDGAVVLWNAPRFSYSAGNGATRTMRIFIDTATTAPGGFPDLSAEDTTGAFTLNPLVGFTQEVPEVDAGGPDAAFQMEQVLPAGAASQSKRFVRVRIRFDLVTVSADPNVLLATFDPPGAPDLPIADDPTTVPIENTFGNLDTAPEGVPAIAELRVTFTP